MYVLDRDQETIGGAAVVQVSLSINRMQLEYWLLDGAFRTRTNSTPLAHAVAHPREGPAPACLERPCLWVPQASGGVVYAKSAGSSSIYVRVEQSTFTGNSVSGIAVRARTDSVEPVARRRVRVAAAPSAVDCTCPHNTAVTRVAAASSADPCWSVAHSSAQQPTPTIFRHTAQ